MSLGDGNPSKLRAGEGIATKSTKGARKRDEVERNAGAFARYTISAGKAAFALIKREGAKEAKTAERL
jgi:hypothetical protein